MQRGRLQATLGYALPGERFRWGKVAIVVIVVIQVMVVLCGGSGAIIATLMCASRSGCSLDIKLLEIGGKVPLVTSPGASCHLTTIAATVIRGLAPVKEATDRTVPVLVLVRVDFSGSPCTIKLYLPCRSLYDTLKLEILKKKRKIVKMHFQV